MRIKRTSKIYFSCITLGTVLLTGLSRLPLFAHETSPKSQDTKSQLDKMFSKCVKDAGTFNNGVLSFCANSVKTKAQKQIKRKLSELGTIKDNDLVLKDQSLWYTYMQSQCELRRRFIGMPEESYCPMIKHIKRNQELNLLLERYQD